MLTAPSRQADHPTQAPLWHPVHEWYQVSSCCFPRQCWGHIRLYTAQGVAACTSRGHSLGHQTRMLSRNKTCICSQHCSHSSAAHQKDAHSGSRDVMSTAALTAEPRNAPWHTHLQGRAWKRWQEQIPVHLHALPAVPFPH